MKRFHLCVDEDERDGDARASCHPRVNGSRSNVRVHSATHTTPSNNNIGRDASSALPVTTCDVADIDELAIIFFGFRVRSLDKIFLLDLNFMFLSNT